MKFNSKQIIIIGGGPTGLTLALYLEKLNIPYILLEKGTFPKDKVCGDAFTPIILKILDELEINHSFDYVDVSKLNVKFNFNNVSQDLSTSFSSNAGVFNSKRIIFDNFLYENIKNKESLHFNTKVTSINYQKKTIITAKDNIKKEISFDKLIIAIGSKRLIFTNEKKYDFNFATRLYVKSNNILNHNYIEFLSDFEFGYFWAFPISKYEFNTGVYFKYNKKDYKNKFKIHLKKLTEILKYEGPIDESLITVWPLKVFHPDINDRQQNFLDVIQIIGDANFSIDPFLGHGIDTGMLEAREVALKLIDNKDFKTKSMIESLIHNKNSKSIEYQNDFIQSNSLSERVDIFKKYYGEISHFYIKINQLITNDKLQRF